MGGERSCDISIASEEAKSHRENRAKQSLGEALFDFFVFFVLFRFFFIFFCFLFFVFCFL